MAEVVPRLLPQRARLLTPRVTGSALPLLPQRVLPHTRRAIGSAPAPAPLPDPRARLPLFLSTVVAAHTLHQQALRPTPPVIGTAPALPGIQALAQAPYQSAHLDPTITAAQAARRA